MNFEDVFSNLELFITEGRKINTDDTLSYELKRERILACGVKYGIS